jgi:uncharacterized membrane protein HdeD (DUF308 family)
VGVRVGWRIAHLTVALLVDHAALLARVLTGNLTVCWSIANRGKRGSNTRWVMCCLTLLCLVGCLAINRTIRATFSLLLLLALVFLLLLTLFPFLADFLEF